jgi:Flp pilus assembly protein TadB
VAGGEGQEAREQQLFDNMRDAVMRLERAIATESRRREEWEREEEERRRTEEQRAEEEGRANAQARLEELERRKAFIIESLRVQKARERLKEIREGKVQAAAAVKVAATRLLHGELLACHRPHDSLKPPINPIAAVFLISLTCVLMSSVRHSKRHRAGLKDQVGG